MAQATSNLLNIGNTLSTASPAQIALGNKISPAPLSQPTALKNTSSSSSVAPLTADQLNAIAKGSGYQGGSFSSTGLSSSPTVSNSSLGIGTQNTQQTQNNTSNNTSNFSNPVIPPSTTTPATYPSLINSLANQGNSPNNQIATQSAGALQTLAGQNPATSGPAFDAYTKAVAEQNALKQGIAGQYANVESNPIPLEFQQGREQVMGRQYASQLDAAQQAVNQQQAGLGYQISGQQTQNSGLSAAGGLANATQGLQQSALGTAAGLAAPRQNGYVMIDPQTGLPLGGNGATSAINQGAQYDAQYQGALGNATDQQSIAGAKNNIDSITQLINNAGLNSSGINIQNATIQQLQKNLSSSDYQTLNNSLQAINAALSKVTGTPIDIAQLSTTQGTSLITTINNAVASAEGIAAGKLNSGSSSGGGSSGGQSLYNF